MVRGTTERPEATTAGTACLVSTSYRPTWENLERLVTSIPMRAETARVVNPYGDGRAAVRVVITLEELLGVGKRLSDFSVL